MDAFFLRVFPCEPQEPEPFEGELKDDDFLEGEFEDLDDKYSPWDDLDFDIIADGDDDLDEEDQGTV
jgi:hypothetical protein